MINQSPIHGANGFIHGGLLLGLDIFQTPPRAIVATEARTGNRSYNGGTRGQTDRAPSDQVCAFDQGAVFRERFFARFYDPAFDEVKPELERVFEKAWDGYIVYRKSPRKKPAGKGFADPTFALPIEWLDTRAKILAAAKRQKDPKSPSRILIVNGSTRSEHSCPGEISKTRRLAQQAQKTIESLRGFAVDFLDLSTLADEPDKTIFPCKACVSTAQPLCHWPCSCYPNHAMGQVNDWMN
ncbi:MAG: hypothetical protein ACXW4Z_23000, partial [Candidatus Binatia bacterium]